jgi:hypothetical protein
VALDPFVSEGEQVVLVIASHAAPTLFGDSPHDFPAAGSAPHQVAGDQDLVGPLVSDILDYGLESRHIAMNVGEYSDTLHSSLGLVNSAFKS